jgi:hypothetical protein
MHPSRGAPRAWRLCPSSRTTLCDLSCNERTGSRGVRKTWQCPLHVGWTPGLELEKVHVLGHADGSGHADIRYLMSTACPLPCLDVHVLDTWSGHLSAKVQVDIGCYVLCSPFDSHCKANVARWLTDCWDGTGCGGVDLSCAMQWRA